MFLSIYVIRISLSFNLRKMLISWRIKFKMFVLIVISRKVAETQSLKLTFEIVIEFELDYLLNNTNSFATTSVI